MKVHVISASSQLSGGYLAQRHTCFPTQRRLQNSLPNLSPPFSHLFVGTDRLSVLFKVSHGREILVRPDTLVLLGTGYGSSLDREWCPLGTWGRDLGWACQFSQGSVTPLGSSFPATVHRRDSEAGAEICALHLYHPPVHSRPHWGHTAPAPGQWCVCDPVTKRPKYGSLGVCVSLDKMTDTAPLGRFKAKSSGTKALRQPLFPCTSIVPLLAKGSSSFFAPGPH